MEPVMPDRRDPRAWEDALRRAQAYLDALDDRGREERARLALDALDRARRRPGDPEALVFAELAQAVGDSGSPPAAVPPLAHSSMAAQDMDYGAMQKLAEETWQRFAWGPVLRAAALWTAIFFLALFTYDRFFAP
jgi:hypothetical protein